MKEIKIDFTGLRAWKAAKKGGIYVTCSVEGKKTTVFVGKQFGIKDNQLLIGKGAITLNEWEAGEDPETKAKFDKGSRYEVVRYNSLQDMNEIKQAHATSMELDNRLTKEFNLTEAQVTALAALD